MALDASVLRGKTFKQAETRLKQRIEEGLRARLSAQGITGMMSLEFDYVDSATHPLLEIGWTPRELYIPSAPGMLTTIADSAEKLFANLEETDVAGMIDEIKNLVLKLEIP